jgi:hypothetical protein
MSPMTTTAPNTKKSGCGCGCGGSGAPCGCGDCPGGRLERPRWYTGQVVTPADLTLEHDYFRKKLRYHNIFMHGWGVVCGATVASTDPTGKTNPYQVTISPGYILGPYGDEIFIDTDRTIDLRYPTTSIACGDPPGPVTDPDCSDLQSPKLPEIIYLAVRYKEYQTRPVRAQPMACDCDGTRCEYSRWRDGYEFGVLDTCPDTPPVHHKALKALKTRARPSMISNISFEGSGEKEDCPPWTIYFNDGMPCLTCPPCPDTPWVVLAKITIEALGVINAKHIDNCSCRRMVPSLAQVVMRCQESSNSSAEKPTPERTSHRGTEERTAPKEKS